MSEHRTPPQTTVTDIVEGLARELEGRATQTHGRFSIGEGDYVITEARTGARNRFLAVLNDRDEETYEALSAAGVAQLDRSKQRGGIVLYRVPVQTKRFSEERIFQGQRSSDTYVSDEELFGHLGSLWARIYQATGKIPEDRPLSHTALVDFGSDTSPLLPIPPYTDWDDVTSPEHAGELFIARLSDQLYETNARESYRELLSIAASAWNQASRVDHE